jgi:signal transduction histidine kinase
MTTRAGAETTFFPVDTEVGPLNVRTRLPGFSRVCAGLVMGAALLVLVGWIGGVPGFIRLGPSAVAMKPMTALGMLLAAVSLWRLAGSQRVGQFDVWAHVPAMIVLLVGLIKLTDYLVGFRFHIDDLLFAGRLLRADFGASELAPHTAVGFILCGVALLLMDIRKDHRICPGQMAILLLGLISLLALLGYGYGVLMFYRIGNTIPMSLESAFSFALLSLGFLVARPQQGVMRIVTSRTVGGTVARRLLPVAIIMPLLLGALLLRGERAGYYHWEFALSIFAAASVVIFSSLIWWNAKLLHTADRERWHAERRVVAQHEATRVLAEALSAREAMPKLLQVLGEALGWRLGFFWAPAEKDRLECAASWHREREEFAEIVLASRNNTLGTEDDLPGQVWSSGLGCGLADTAKEKQFRRAQLAAAKGLKSAYAFPIFADQHPYGVIEFFSDDSDMNDPALKAMLQTVATQVGLFAERTRAEEQLRQMTANLQRSNTDLQQFASIASHDLFEPLRMVTSYLQLLSHRYGAQLDQQAGEFIRLAIDGAKRMHALIHDLLEYSRVESRGRAFEPTDVQEVVNAALANLKVAIDESGARVASHNLPQVKGDSVQLTQLFQNLIGNAIKFRGTEPPVIEISAERHETELRFCVRDNGIGIDPKYFERIFVVFQRLHTRQEYPGTGMGLAICKKIVERHGGRIWVQSQPGKGAEFWFTLPEAR